MVMTTVAFDDCELDVGGLELRRGCRSVDLSPRSSTCSSTWWSTASGVVSKTELLDQDWHNRFVSESAHTSRLKRAASGGRRRGHPLDCPGRAQRRVAHIRLVLVNVANPAEVVAEAAALVRPGGALVVQEVDWLSWQPASTGVTSPTNVCCCRSWGASPTSWTVRGSRRRRARPADGGAGPPPRPAGDRGRPGAHRAGLGVGARAGDGRQVTPGDVRCAGDAR